MVGITPFKMLYTKQLIVGIRNPRQLHAGKKLEIMFIININLLFSSWFNIV